ncbi:MAG: phosphohistidine phosphatase SixA [Candidatus Kaelpia imicola]|nr:phosphohistidine phosphatase SixA [Candidatus Kaelpia imicola]
MRLYLVRHGEAASGGGLATDRPLSKEGIGEVKRVADFIKIKTSSIWVSNRLRAKQTAQIFREYRLSNNLIERDDLAPNDPVDAICSDIIDYNGDLMIVGHLPFLSNLASSLLSASGDSIGIDFHAASILSLEREDEAWSLSWFLNPDLIVD